MAHQQESFYLFPPTMSLLHSSKLLTESSSSLLHYAFQLPKLRGKWSIKAYWFQPTSLLHLGLSSGTNLPLHPHFPQSATPVSSPTFFFPAFLGCHSKSRQAWPCGMEPTIYKLSSRCKSQGELPPSYILDGSHSHLPGSKLGHSHLTYP